MLAHQPELQAQLEGVNFTSEVAETIGQQLLDLSSSASPSQDIKVELLLGEDEHGEPAAVRYAIALMTRPS
jgi:hypothetical protein